MAPPRRILIVEDDLLNMELAVDILEVKGYEVLRADNGFRALQILKTTPLDLVIMDIQLPDFDGISLCAEIRKDAAFRNLPVIAFTAHAMKGDEEKFLAAGFNAYAAKPIDTREFPNTVANCLSASATLNAAASQPPSE